LGRRKDIPSVKASVVQVRLPHHRLRPAPEPSEQINKQIGEPGESSEISMTFHHQGLARYGVDKRQVLRMQQ